MCTKFNPFDITLTKLAKRFLFTLMVVFSMQTAFTQNNSVMVNVFVAPPYTSSISDYINIPNKIMITLTNTSLDKPDLNVYLKASIIGDNGVSAISDPAYKPATSILLQKGVPYVLNNSNISEAFDIEHIVTQGISLNQLMNGAGLPEGFYQICVQAFDFATDQPVSMDSPSGCSNMFSITNLEPPMFNFAFCGESVISNGNQAVNVSWTIPAGAPLGTLYHFEMVEIPENVQINPNEAFLTAKFPVLYEETTPQMMLLLTVNKVSLNPGYTYVMRVTAEDPMGKANFRNGGTSEVCSFKYELINLSMPQLGKFVKIVLPAVNHLDSIYAADPITGFQTTWRVWEIMPNDTVTFPSPLKDYPNSIFLVEFYDAQGGEPIFSDTTSNQFYYANPSKSGFPFVDGKSYKEKITVIDKTTNEVYLISDIVSFKYQFGNLQQGMAQRKITGKIDYKFETGDAEGLYPVTDAQVKLVAQYILNDSVKHESIVIPDLSIPAELAVSLKSLNPSSIATAITSISGNFTINFNWPENINIGVIKPSFTYSQGSKTYTGELSYTLKLVLDNPYYEDINHEISTDQEQYNLGTLQTHVKSYALNAIVAEGYKNAPGIKKNLVGKKVYIFRKTRKPGTPNFEGDIMASNQIMALPNELKGTNFLLVATGLTKSAKDANGIDIATVSFNRLIQNLVNGDEYYFLLEGSSSQVAEPFSYTVSIDNSFAQIGANAGTNININGANYFAPGGTGGSSSGGSISGGLHTSTTYSSQYQVNTSGGSGSNVLLGLQGGTLTGVGLQNLAGSTNTSGSSQGSGYSLQGANLNLSGSGSGSGLGQFSEVGSEFNGIFGGNYTLPEFNFSNDKISESAGTFSNIQKYSFTVESAFTLLSSQPPMSGISGRIVYEFPAKAGNSRPLANQTISIISCLVSDVPGDDSKLIKNDKFEDHPDAYPNVQLLYTSKTDPSGYFNFQFPNILPNESTPDPQDGTFNISTGNLNRNASWQSWESDPETHFRITFDKKYVKVKRVLRIIVEDAAGIYLSPCENILIEPLKSADVGTLNSEVFSYKLKGGLTHDVYNPQDTVGNYKKKEKDKLLLIPHNEPIQKAECYVLRVKSQINSLNLPSDEGQNIVGELEGLSAFKIISKAETNSAGEFVFDNLIFRNTTAPAFLYFRTKDMMGDANYKPVWTVPQVNKFKKPAYFFRNDYNYSTIQGYSSKMEPRNPTLKGRVISDVNAQKGINNALVSMKVSFSNRGDYNFNITTDSTGKFDMTGAFNFLSDVKWIDSLTNVYLKISKYGFHYLENGAYKSVWENNYDKAYFEKGKQLILDNIILYSNGSIKGRVVNEYGTPVEAYVQFLENSSNSAVEVGAMHRTGESTFALLFGSSNNSGPNNGLFNIPAVPGNNRKLVVIPKDVTYFSDTITVNVLNGTPTDKGDIKVFERSHRLYFYVKKAMPDGQYGPTAPIAGAKVSIIGSSNIPPFIAGSDGKVVLSFKNVSESNLSVSVSGPSGSNLVPKIVSFTNEESETPVQLPTVYLESGLTVKGKVLLDGTPTPDAEVYLELSKGSQTEVDNFTAASGQSSSAESQYLFTARTKADGTFEINTIPPELRNKKIVVKAIYKKAETIANIGLNTSLGAGIGNGAQSNINSNTSGGTNYPVNGTNNISGLQNNSNLANQSNQGNSSQLNSGLNAQNLSSSSNIATQAQVVEAPIDTNTVIGDSKEVYVTSIPGTIQLNLTTYNDMAIKTVWGFPIEITKIEKILNSNKVKVSGRVKPDNYSPGFDPLEPLNLEVNNVIFKPSDERIGSKVIGIPENSSVPVSVLREFKLKYAKAFNVKLKAANNQPFVINRENESSNKGRLSATVQIIDNSFQFPSSYLNFEGTNFYFCTLTQSQIYSTPKIYVDVYKSDEPGNGNTIKKFNLCNIGSTGLGQNLSFKFINFNTTASSSKSFIEGNAITLNATLNANVKNAGEVKIEVGNLVLKNNTIAPISGDTPLMITLKDAGIYNAEKAWKFEAKNWEIDPKQGGLMSKNCILHTGSIDIPFSYFNLRSDFAYIGDPNCDNLTMGGYKVTRMPGSEATVGYNASCGSDSKGHWQLILHPASTGYWAGKSPAIVAGLPNMNANLELETVSLLSNGEDVFTIGTGAAKMKLYNVVDFKPQTVFSLSDGLVLTGGVDFKIPRVQQNIGARLTFVKNAPETNNPKADAIDIGFEAKGNVKFKINQDGQKFDRDLKTFTTYGTVEEPGKLNPIQVLLTYNSKPSVSQITTTIVESPNAKNQTVKIGENNTWLEKVKCAMNADQTDWTLLTFEGDMVGFNGLKPNCTKHMVFTVHGEIEANQDGFKAEGVDSEFGGMKISYQNGRLIGTLTMTNVPLGSVIVSGVANILMDSNGWAFYSNCKADGVPAPEATTVKMGILIGNYPIGITSDMSNTVLAYAVKKQMPETFKNGLKGFFMVGGRDLPLSGLDIGINVVVASAYVRIPIAAVDASFFGNFLAGETVIGMGLNGAIVIEFGLGSITCTDLSGNASATVTAEGVYKNKSLNFSGGADFSASLSVSQGIPYLAGCIDAVSIKVPTLSGGFNFNLNPFDVHMYLK